MGPVSVAPKVLPPPSHTRRSAAPGPACYGRGGRRPTVTDANLVLGRLQPDAFLGGAMVLDVAAAGQAVASVAGPLGMALKYSSILDCIIEVSKSPAIARTAFPG